MARVARPDDPPLYGTATRGAMRNFNVSGRPVPVPVITAIAHIKAASALANATDEDVTGVNAELAAAIVAAADEIVAGRWPDQFPIDVFQTGSGTSTNMNVNEVIASLASDRLGRPVHPNDHVNASQSTNDVFPSAIRLAAVAELQQRLVPALNELADRLGDRADDWAEVVKAGRTHLMDATPMMLGDEFGAYRQQVVDAISRLESTVGRLAAVPLGGTAVGTGINTPPGHSRRVVGILADRTGFPLTPARNRLAEQGSQDALIELSAQLRGTAVALFKIANDIRWLASGPRAGLGEIAIPELQAGSSIMPGKANPVICEVVLQVAARVLGNDATIAFAGTQGNLELNVFLPVMALSVLESIDLLSGAAADLADTTVRGLEADVERCRQLAEATPALATALNPVIGYDRATEIVRLAMATGQSIEDAAVASGHLDRDTASRLLDPVAMARGSGQDPNP